MIGTTTSTFEGIIKTTATFADPAELTGGNSDHQGKVLDVLSDNRAAANKGTFANGVTTDDGAVGSEGGAFADECLGIDAVNGEMGTWCRDIGEDAGWAAEHIVFYLHTFIDRHIVLDTDTIADADIVADVHILTQRAVLAEAGTTLDMAEMPDLRTLANLYIVIDVTAFVNVILFH